MAEPHFFEILGWDPSQQQIVPMGRSDQHLTRADAGLHTDLVVRLMAQTEALQAELAEIRGGIGHVLAHTCPDSPYAGEDDDDSDDDDPDQIDGFPSYHARLEFGMGQIQTILGQWRAIDQMDRWEELRDAAPAALRRVEEVVCRFYNGELPTLPEPPAGQ